MKKITSLFVCFTVAIIFSSFSCTPNEPLVPASMITFHVGMVKIISQGRPARDAAVMDVVGVNDIITTGKEAEAVVQIGDNIVVNILSESRVSFISLIESAKIELKLESGKVLNKLGKLKAQREFRITTKTATASVRGTTFLVFYENKAATVAVGEGAVMVRKVSPEAKIEEKKEGVGPKPEEKEEGIVFDVTKNNSVVISEEPAVKPAPRPISEVETLYIRKIATQPVIPRPALKTKQEIKKEIEKIQEQVKPEIKQIEKKIDEFYPQSIQKISQNYDRVDEVKLYNGKTYHGIIVSRGDRFLVMSTPEGRINIPVNKIKYTGIKK
jgi:hypothetical protein